MPKRGVEQGTFCSREGRLTDSDLEVADVANVVAVVTRRRCLEDFGLKLIELYYIYIHIL